MSNLIRSTNGTLSQGGDRSLTVPDRRTQRALVNIERQTLTRMAAVRGDAMVQTEKTYEVDRLVREAMGGQAMLARWGQTLAAGDPFIADDLRFFTDLAKTAKGQIIADTVSSFGRGDR